MARSPEAFEAPVAGQGHKLPGFLVGDRRGLTLVAIDFGALDALDWIGRHSILIGQVLI